jgi:hypothetical protein
VAVAKVQFTLNGSNLGNPVTTSPFQMSWDTKTVANGTYTISAVATDTSANTATAVPVTVTVSNSVSTATQDFQNRCTATGVIVCIGFDASADVAQNTYLFPAGDGVYRGTLDTSTYASGGSSLKFTVPSLGGANSAGFWSYPFGQNFAQNSTFYVQFRQRFSPEFISNTWKTSSGADTYWKQVDFHWGDFATKNLSTCGQIELTTINFQNTGHPTMYTGCGATGFYQTIGSSIFIEQGDTATTGYNCLYGPFTNCFTYPSNTWVTFYYQINIGTWGVPNSSVKAWVALPGQPYVEWINFSGLSLNIDSPIINAYNYMSLFPYMTGRDSTVSAGPTAYTWYDEVIVSTQPVAAPQAPPAAP